MTNTDDNATTKREATLLGIAVDTLNIFTLETRNNDRSDFHAVSVWGVRDALRAAYQAGIEAAQSDAAKPEPDTVPPTGICPRCGQNDIDQLVWDDDGETVTCQTCGTNYTIHPIG